MLATVSIEWKVDVCELKLEVKYGVKASIYRFDVDSDGTMVWGDAGFNKLAISNIASTVTDEFDSENA